MLPLEQMLDLTVLRAFKLSNLLIIVFVCSDPLIVENGVLVRGEYLPLFDPTI